ncbi:MAG: hypothetical protein WCP68_00490 [Enhydrobacter sp.]
MSTKQTAARIYLTTRGQWGRYEYSLADFDWDTHRYGARYCNDEVRLKAKTARGRPDDHECRLNILKAAVQRMEQAIFDSRAA